MEEFTRSNTLVTLMKKIRLDFTRKHLKELLQSSEESFSGETKMAEDAGHRCFLTM